MVSFCFYLDFIREEELGNLLAKKNKKSLYPLGFQSNLLPVAKSVGIDVDLGMGTGSAGGILIMQGPDAGKMVGFSDVGGGLAVPDASIAIQETNFWVTGSVNNFTIEKLNGFRNDAFVGGTIYNFDITGSFIWSNPDISGGRVIGGGFGIGVSVIPIWLSGGWNEGKTTIYK